MNDPGGSGTSITAANADPPFRTNDRQTKPMPTAPDIDYYGVPPIHAPHWKWLIVTYFYLGGISGSSYVIATIADRLDDRSNRQIVQTARYLALAAFLPCPVLLILDLGRPKRFLYMLRVLKLRSPMSLGTWGLSALGLFVTLSAIVETSRQERVSRRLVPRGAETLNRHWISTIGTGIALFVAGYTGVLLAATAVPLWMKRPLFLGPVFLCSSFSTAAAAIELILTVLPDSDYATRHRLARLEVVALLAEMSLLGAWLVRLGSTAEPLTLGQRGQVFRQGVVGIGMVAPLMLRAMTHRDRHTRGRITAALAALCALAGGFALRYAVVTGGHASAQNPRATFDLARRN